nr:MAG TPA: hypothetical protein [Caudoviricetes sp.]DAW60068.1 MAG TPA: hypothetical protein [Caudoviricetes sp.]
MGKSSGGIRNANKPKSKIIRLKNCNKKALIREFNHLIRALVVAAGAPSPRGL